MPLNPNLPRRISFFFVLALITALVVGWTWTSRNQARESSNLQALQLLQSQVLAFVDRALLPAPWKEPDLQLFERLRSGQASAREHRNAEALFHLRGRLGEGVELYRRLLRERPGDPLAMFGLGGLLLDAGGSPAEARALLQKALERDPTLWRAELKLASTMPAAEARARCSKILKQPLEPAAERLAAAYQDAAVYSLRLERPSDALQFADRALASLDRSSPDPLTPLDRAQARWARGRALLELGSAQEALQDLRQALELAREMDMPPIEMLLLQDLAGALRRRGSSAEAEEIEIQLAALFESKVDRQKLVEIVPWLNSMGSGGGRLQ